MLNNLDFSFQPPHLHLRPPTMPQDTDYGSAHSLPLPPLQRWLSGLCIRRRSPTTPDFRTRMGSPPSRSSPLRNPSELMFLDPPCCRSVDLQFCDRAFYRSSADPIFAIGHVTVPPHQPPHLSPPWRPSQDSTRSFLSPGMFFSRPIVQDNQ